MRGQLTPQENYEREDTVTCPLHVEFEIPPGHVCPVCRWPEEVQAQGVEVWAAQVLWQIYTSACMCGLDDSSCVCPAADHASGALWELLGEDWHGIMTRRTLPR